MKNEIKRHVLLPREHARLSFSNSATVWMAASALPPGSLQSRLDLQSYQGFENRWTRYETRVTWLWNTVQCTRTAMLSIANTCAPTPRIAWTNHRSNYGLSWTESETWTNSPGFEIVPFRAFGNFLDWTIKGLESSLDVRKYAKWWQWSLVYLINIRNRGPEPRGNLNRISINTMIHGREAVWSIQFQWT